MEQRSTLVDDKSIEDQKPALLSNGASDTQYDDALQFPDTDDPADPLNWPKKKKWTIVMLLSALSTIG